MCAETAIEWTATRLPDGTTLPGYTFNPWEGCQKVGPGCDHCYAEARNIRFTGGVNWGPHAPRRLTSAANWRKPIKWNKEAAKSGIRRNVFCASLADVMDTNDSILSGWRIELGELILATPHLNWLLLTKRIGNAPAILRQMFPDGVPPNVWLGITVVNQTEADRDIPKLLATKAHFGITVAFLSMEPLLGPVDLKAVKQVDGYSINALAGTVDDFGIPFMDAPGKIDWVIVGGESGPNARPMHPDWASSILQQCEAAGVAGFFKQWGEWAPDTGPLPGRDLTKNGSDPIMEGTAACALWTGSEWQHYRDGYAPPIDDTSARVYRISKARAGRLLDGREWNQMPGAM